MNSTGFVKRIEVLSDGWGLMVRDDGVQLTRSRTFFLYYPYLLGQSWERATALPDFANGFIHDDSRLDAYCRMWSYQAKRHNELGHGLPNEYGHAAPLDMGSDNELRADSTADMRRSHVMQDELSLAAQRATPKEFDRRPELTPYSGMRTPCACRGMIPYPFHTPDRCYGPLNGTNAQGGEA